MLRFIVVFSIFLISLLASVQAKEDIASPTLKQDLPLAEFSVAETPQSLKMTISSPKPFIHRVDFKDNYLILTCSPLNFNPSDSHLFEFHKGLIESALLSNIKDSAVIKIKYLLRPEYTLKDLSGSSNRVFLELHCVSPHHDIPRRAIKTRNTYRAGESILSDMGVLLEASGSKKNPSSFMPLEKVAVADIKKDFKENIALIKSFKEGNPALEKKSSPISVLNHNFFPIEKRESLDISFDNKNISEILKVLSLKSNKNLIVSPLVRGKRSIEFKDMTPEEAIYALLVNTGYDFKIRDNTILVAPAGTLERLTDNESPGFFEKRVFVLKKIRGEKIIKIFESFFPGIKYTFYPKLNAFEIQVDSESIDGLERFFEDVDSVER